LSWVVIEVLFFFLRVALLLLVFLVTWSLALATTSSSRTLATFYFARDHQRPCHRSAAVCIRAVHPHHLLRNNEHSRTQIKTPPNLLPTLVIFFPLFLSKLKPSFPYKYRLERLEPLQLHAQAGVER
jgi:hypothetical protein